MDYHDVVWAQCDKILQPWKKTLFEHDILRERGRLVDKHRGVPDELFAPKQGIFQRLASNAVHRWSVSPTRATSSMR